MPAHVATPQGEKRFKKPVGSLINIDGTPRAEQPPVTVVRIQSLQRALAAAKATGNQVTQDRASADLLAALRLFAEGRTPIQVKEALKAPAKAP